MIVLFVARKVEAAGARDPEQHVHITGPRSPWTHL
jgi:hypothetical protein